MHDTAMENGRLFFQTYGRPDWETVVDCGAMDVNGSLRSVCHWPARYLGVDLEAGKSVDFVVESGGALPFPDGFADCILSSSQLEHDDFFWVTFLEFCRVVKPNGFIYINAPSNGAYHRFPNDNWRFYPDSGHVLVRWAARNGVAMQLEESFIGDRLKDQWNDFVAVFSKAPHGNAPPRFLADQVACRNVWKRGATEPERVTAHGQDAIMLRTARNEIAKLKAELARLKEAQAARPGLAPGSARPSGS